MSRIKGKIEVVGSSPTRPGMAAPVDNKTYEGKKKGKDIEKDASAGLYKEKTYINTK